MGETRADWAERLEATLRFAWRSRCWIVPGGPEHEGPPPRDEPVAEEARGEEAAPEAGADPAARLQAVREELGDCRRCRLWQGRTHLVFGVGNPRARLLFVGEAPGAEEDRKGEPFVGRAGHLLDRMIQALGLRREDVYIANVLKCRPPKNRDPSPDEAATCLPFLWRQIDAIRPDVICALGAHAARNLLDTDASIGALRGRAHRVRGWTVVATYHPAYLLRNPSAKRLAWRDLKLVGDLLEPGR
ncbi:MAG: hypothetical protein Kow0092_05890 [Deferrisomatales bacterium]